MKYKVIFLLLTLMFATCKDDAEWKHKEVSKQEQISSLRHSAEVKIKFDSDSKDLIDGVWVVFSTKADFSNAKTLNMQRQKDYWLLELTGLQDSATYFLKYNVSPWYMQFADSVSSFQAINPNPPTVKTLFASDITYTTAVLYGVATQGDNYEITDQGFYYSLLQNSGDYERKKVVCGKGERDFSVKIEHLRANADYYFCAYASNRNGETCADTLTFHTENPY